MATLKIKKWPHFFLTQVWMAMGLVVGILGSKHIRIHPLARVRFGAVMVKFVQNIKKERFQILIRIAYSAQFRKNKETQDKENS